MSVSLSDVKWGHLQVKLAKEKEPMPLTSQPPSVPQPDTESEAADGVKARSKSISEQLEHNEVVTHFLLLNISPDEMQL